MLDVQLFDLQSFLPLPYKEALLPRLKKAHEKLQAGTGLGGEFTGWVHLPRDYDRGEFARIQAAAERMVWAPLSAHLRSRGEREGSPR